MAVRRAGVFSNGVDAGFQSAFDYVGGSFKNPSSAFNLNRFMKAQRGTLAWAEIGGHSLVDPLNFFKDKKKPPAVAPPPPPPDTTGSMLREISRAQTDADIRKTKRRSFMGGY